jgi:putative oxidoreductase
MAKAVLVSRLLLGLIYTVFGLAGLFQLLPVPPDMPEAVQKFMEGAMATGYLMTLIKLTESVCGIMLLANIFSPLALVILAPISLNIFLFHAFTSPDGLPMGIIICALHLFLGMKNLDKFRPMFSKI